jgi:CRP/FNR family transcriptional regulator
MHGAWIERFEELAALPEPVRNTLAAGSHMARASCGSVLFQQGQAVESLLFVLDGSVRVQQVSGNGREVFLYRVHPGESCVLTTACMLAFESYAAEGIAETDVEAVTIPRILFNDLAGSFARVSHLCLFCLFAADDRPLQAD